MTKPGVHAKLAAINESRALAAMPIRQEILDLRIKGWSTARIAEKLGIKPPHVRRHIRKCFEILAKDQAHLAERLRNLSQSRLEELLKAHWEQAVSGKNPEAAKLVLSIIEKELRLFGLEAPPKVEFNQYNLVNLPQEELERRARMVGLDLSGGVPQLAHDPEVIDTEVVRDE